MATGSAAVARYVVRMPNWLGDALMARPLFFALKAALPDAHATAVGPAGLLALLEGDGLWQRSVPWQDRAGALAAVRAERPQLAVVCPPSFSSAWFAWRCGASVRVGFRSEFRDALLTHAVARPARGELHLSGEYLGLAQALGFEALDEVPALRAPVAASIVARQLAGEGPYAILAPGAIYGPAKRWPLERFAAVARGLAGFGLRVLVCGAQGDRAIADAVVASASAGAIALAGRTDLAVQTALCAGARVVVCNDSGLAHLAAATGAPTVSVFGSTSSAWTAPLGPRVRVVQRPPLCSPCFQRTCRIGYGCLTAVAVEDVMRAAIALASQPAEVA